MPELMQQDVVSRVLDSVPTLDTAWAIVIVERYDGRYSVFGTDSSLATFGPTYAFLNIAEVHELQAHLRKGRVQRRYVEFTPEQRSGLLHSNLPIEWHRQSEGFIGSRVVVWTQLPQITRTEPTPAGLVHDLEQAREQALAEYRDRRRSAYLWVLQDLISEYNEQAKICGSSLDEQLMLQALMASTMVVEQLGDIDDQDAHDLSGGWYPSRQVEDVVDDL